MRALCLLADGFEEIEAVTFIDILERAGVKVDKASVDKPTKEVNGGHGIVVIADLKLSDVKPSSYDILYLPGGLGNGNQGAKILGGSIEVKNLIDSFIKDGKWVTALCAAPGVVLGEHGYLDGHKFTCYPSFEKHVSKGEYQEGKRVVFSKPFITGNGIGGAIEFSLAIVREFVNAETAEALAKGILYQ